MGALDGRCVVVTGAFGVLGRATASAAEAAGARVARVDFAAAAQPAGDLTFGGVDIADETAARRVMGEIAQRAGGVDGLVNIAGGFVWSPLAESPVKVWEDMFRLNLATAVSATRAALDYLSAGDGGAVVNIGAGAATRAAAGMGPYAAAKSAVARLTESLAEELMAANVRVNAVLPSIIDTPTNRRDMPNADFSTWVQPHDIANVIVYLLSDAAHAITGAAVPVTMGRR